MRPTIITTPTSEKAAHRCTQHTLIADPYHEITPEQSAQVDAGIKKPEASISTRIVIVVEHAYHRADIRLKETGADDREANSNIEQFFGREGNGEASDNHQGRAPHQGFLEAEDLVGEEATNKGEGVDKSLDGTVLQIDGSVVESQLAHHEYRQHASHAVETETFPHFCGEQIPKLFGILALKVADRLKRVLGCWHDEVLRSSSG